MSEVLETPSTDERVLHGEDLWLFRFGIGFLCLSVCTLVQLGCVFFSDFYSDFLTFDGALAAAGAVLGSVATTFAAIGSALLFVVSLRVQARELRHSIKELKNSVVAQKEAADNHRQAVAIAQQQLSIAKQEMEFNVITTTIGEVRAHIEGIEHVTTHGRKLQGYAAIQLIIESWVVTFERKGLEDPGKKWLLEQLTGVNPGALLPHYSSLEELLVKLTWLSSASVTKPLDDGDRRYLWARINPIVDYTKNALGKINKLDVRLDALVNESKPSDRIHQMHPGLAECWRRVNDLAKRSNDLKRPVVGL